MSQSTGLGPTGLGPTTTNFNQNTTNLNQNDSPSAKQSQHRAQHMAVLDSLDELHQRMKSISEQSAVELRIDQIESLQNSPVSPSKKDLSPSKKDVTSLDQVGVGAKGTSAHGIKNSGRSTSPS